MVRKDVEARYIEYRAVVCSPERPVDERIYSRQSGSHLACPRSFAATKSSSPVPVGSIVWGPFFTRRCRNTRCASRRQNWDALIRTQPRSTN